MERLVLQSPVTVTGRNFWGQKVSVTLKPTEAPGWWWEPYPGFCVAITMDIVQGGARGIDLVARERSNRRATLSASEHLLALRLFGVDNICIIGQDLPYDGSAKIFWSAMEPMLRRDGRLQPIHLPHTGIVLQSKPGTNNRFVVTEPPREYASLCIAITIDYKGGLNRGGVITLREPHITELREKIIGARTLGWPPYLKRVGRVAQLCLGWPHHDHIVWPSQENQTAVAEEVFYHRILDLCGGIASALPPGRIPIGRIDSVRGGHAYDVVLARLLAEHWN